LHYDYKKENVLNTVRYAEFGLSSCNVGENASTQIGKHLMPFLNTHMPYLQTLRLWRPDDFPWTSSKFNFQLTTIKIFSSYNVFKVEKN